MTFGLYFKELLEIQLKKDNIYYPNHIKSFVYSWDKIIWKNTYSHDLLLLTNIIYKEVFLYLFFNKTINITLINKCFNVLNII